MSFIRCKTEGKKIDVRASDITAYVAEEKGTTLLLRNAGTITVEESQQAIRSRIAKVEGTADTTLASED